jgi:hypothetical protein
MIFFSVFLVINSHRPLTCNRESASRRVPQLENQLKTTSMRLDAAEQLIGEKEEELADLRQDLGHVKEMFRRQISDLLDEIGKMKGPHRSHPVATNTSHTSHSVPPSPAKMTDRRGE